MARFGILSQLPCRLPRAALLVTTALTSLICPLPTHAQDATWLANPGTADLNTGSNWDTGSVPTGTATFGTSNTTALTLGTAGSYSGWTFNAGASAYTFDVTANQTFTGAGIVINGGSATITSNMAMAFYNSASAGSATITNASTSVIEFLHDTTAGTATITNNGGITFHQNATADHATIVNNNAISFWETATAGDAVITNNSILLFRDNSTAGNAAIANGANAITNFALTTGLNGDNKISAGSIAGGGTYGLGANELTVGSNNLSTEVSGAIAGAGGSLVKIGTGTLTLSGANTYTGGTTIDGGTLVISGSIASGTVTNTATLTYAGSASAGSAAIANNFGGTLNFDNTSTAGSAAITNDGTLNFNNTSTAASASITNNNSLFFNDTSTAGSATITNNSGTLQTTDTGSLGNATITNNAYLFLQNSSTAGSATITNNQTIYFYYSSTAGTATITNNNDLNFTTDSSAGSAHITNNSGGGLSFYHASTAGSATITNNYGMGFYQTSTAGNAAITNNYTLGFNGDSSAGSATITNSGNLAFGSTSTAGNATIINNNNLIFYGTAGSATITNNIGGNTFFRDSSDGGSARFINNAGSTFDISGLTASGTAAGSIEGAGSHLLGGKTLAVGGNNLSTTVSGVIADGGANGGTGGALIKTGTGTLTLSGTNTYTGGTTISGGTLAVNSTLTATSGITVNNGGALGGTGTVGATTVNAGGTLAPGNSIGTLSVQGNLTFNAGATYSVEVSPTAADRTNVTGSATLTGATVQAIALPGSFRAQTYTILNATGGFGGTQFAGITGSSFAPGARNPHLTYDTNNVFLVLDPGTIQLPTGASGNQASVAGGINKAVESGATPPAAFDALLNMSGAQLTNALNQVSGQPATGAATSGTQMTTSFLTLVLNPNAGATGGATFGGARSFASEPAVSPDAAAAYAAVTPKDKRLVAFAEPRWSVWGQVYGGYNKTNGDTADSTARTWGLATGFDYRAAPDLTFGFALAGGSTNWGLSQGLGGGKSDVLQLGVYGRKEFGPAYLSAALSYAWHNMSTDRTVTVSGADKLTANFDAHSFGSRIEAGYRFATPWLGVTPYAALQVQTFRTPSYSESATSGSNAFALAYDARSTTATRTELGAWFDNTIALDRGNTLALRSRAAWAYNHSSDEAMDAVFQTLPGSNFTVNGAQAAPNALLTSLGADLRLANNWSIGARFDGEFASGSQTYAGTGTVRYAW